MVKMLTFKQAVAALGFTPKVVRKMIKDGSLKASRPTGPLGSYRIEESEVLRFQKADSTDGRSPRPCEASFIDASGKVMKRWIPLPLTPLLLIPYAPPMSVGDFNSAEERPLISMREFRYRRVTRADHWGPTAVEYEEVTK
jgi:excisionase family DNA binding protein